MEFCIELRLTVFDVSIIIDTNVDSCIITTDPKILLARREADKIPEASPSCESQRIDFKLLVLSEGGLIKAN